VLCDGEIGWSVIGSDAGFVIAENHVHDPMQTVLDAPVGSDGGCDDVGGIAQRGDVEPGFALDLGAGLAFAFDDHDAVQAWPVVPFSQPVDIVNDGGFAGLDAAVVGVDGQVGSDGRIFEVMGLLFVEEEFDIVPQGSLVTPRLRGGRLFRARM
jgi:hypothetical protein